MKRILPFLATLFFVIKAGAQDTVIVQTLTWDSTVRSGTFSFPNDPPNTWRKIIMLYNMRCHDAAVGSGNVGCREWDYSCNTFIRDSSYLDSTQLTHPSHFISDFDNSPGITFRYTSQPVFSYYLFNQRDVSYSSATGETNAKVGADENPVEWIDEEQTTGKIQYLFTAAELTAAGLRAGIINGLKIQVAQAGSAVRFLKIKMKQTSAASLSPDTPELDGFTEVYFKDTDLSTAGTHHLKFYQGLTWDGSSNIIVEWSMTRASSNTPIEVMAQTISPDKGLTSFGEDNAFEFNGGGVLDVSEPALQSVTDQITIAFWAKGNENVLPKNCSIFEAFDAANQRQLNVHLPWSNSRIYWDCGNDGTGYDRIDKLANPADFEGQWNHYAFTKNASTGEMKIFINGQLWHQGTGLTKSIDINRMVLGNGFGNNANYYPGMVDEFQIWKAALSQAEINQIMHRSVLDNPRLDDLVARYAFDELEGNMAFNEANGHEAPINGSIGRVRRWGDQIFKEFLPVDTRIATTFVQGTYSLLVDEIEVEDSTLNNPNMLVTYGLNGTDLITIDTQFVWDVDRSYVYDADGFLSDFRDVPVENSVTISTLDYYSKTPGKFEILSLVTPYGNGLDLGRNGVTFNIDVTDYAPILRGDKFMSLELGGQNQEEMDIKFMFIKGTPPRNIISVQNIWPFRRGNIDQILNDVAFEPRNVQLNPDGKMFKVRAAITGHQQNGEFVIRNHYINLNGGAKEFNFDVFKECSDVPIYPQGGTWIFDRAGWCPGDPTVVHQFDITNRVTPGQPVEIDYGVNGLTMTEANYLVSAQLVTYGAPNFVNDAELLEIIRPTNQLEHARFNPSCSRPTIRIRNSGSAALRSLTIEYGERGGSKVRQRWNGNLAFMQTEDVELNLDFYSFWLDSADPGIFEVTLLDPNDVADDYAENNVGSATFTRPRVFQRPIVVEIRTNLRPTETTWRLKNMEGDILLERIGLAPNTNYLDELMLGRGCYTLEINDSNDDGLYYWYWEQTGDSRGRGLARILDVYPNGIKIPVVNFEPEFGRFISYDLAVPNNVSSTVEPGEFEFFSLYPNPAADQINLDLQGFKAGEIEVEIFDITGKILGQYRLHVTDKDFQTQIDISQLPKGHYQVRLRNESRVWTREVVRM